MGRLWSCGFELQSLITGVEVTNPNGGAISTSTKRSGAASYRTNPTASSAYIGHNYSTGSTATWARVYFNLASYPTSINNDPNVLYPSNEIGIGTFITPGASEDFIVTLSSSGTVQLWDTVNGVLIGSSSAVLNLNQWYRLEFFEDGGGNVELRLDGVSLGIGIILGTYGSNIIFAFGVNPGNLYGESSTATVDIYWDDAALNDISGSFQTSWPGEGKIVHLHPDAAGDSNDWLHDDGSAGDATNYTECMEVTPDDGASYVKRTTTGIKTDKYGIGSPISAGLTVYDIITAVQVGIRSKTTALGAGRTMLLTIQSQAAGGGQFSGIFSIASTIWTTNGIDAQKPYKLTSYIDPTTGAPWKVLGANSLDNAQIGFSNTVSSTNELDISTLWALVDYIPKPTSLGPPISWGLP